MTPSAIRQDVLVVRGTRDRWCTKAIAEQYADSFPSGRYENVDEVGHLVPEESPESLADLVARFASRS